MLKPLAKSLEEERKREQFLGTDLVPTHKQSREEARKRQSETGSDSSGLRST
jgi:hypothetical protein